MGLADRKSAMIRQLLTNHRFAARAMARTPLSGQTDWCPGWSLLDWFCWKSLQLRSMMFADSVAAIGRTEYHDGTSASRFSRMAPSHAMTSPITTRATSTSAPVARRWPRRARTWRTMRWCSIARQNTTAQDALLDPRVVRIRQCGRRRARTAKACAA